MKRIQSFFMVMMTAVVMFTTASFISPTIASAQDTDVNLICRIFPFINQIEFTQGLCGGESNLSAIGELVRFVLSLIFIAIIGIAVFYIIKSAIKYIQSEGDEGKVQESQKAIKAVFLGIGALIVGLVGLIIILAFVGADEALQQDIPEDSSINQTLNDLTGL